MRFWGVITRETKDPVRQRPQARASHPKARSHNPITAPERLKGKIHTPSQSRCGTPHRNLAVHEFPLSAHPQLRQISRVMRFAEVKEEAEGRGTRSKAHRSADSSTTAKYASAQLFESHQAPPACAGAP